MADHSGETGGVRGSGLSGFVDSYGEHVFYVSTDQHVHHLNSTGTWADTDLTANYSGPQAAFATALSSFGDGYGDHVIYISADQHVHQLYYDNANWVDQDLTGTAKPVEESQVPLAAVGTALSSLSNSLGELIFYISADQHVHLLVFANTPPGFLHSRSLAQQRLAARWICLQFDDWRELGSGSLHVRHYQRLAVGPHFEPRDRRDHWDANDGGDIQFYRERYRCDRGGRYDQRVPDHGGGPPTLECPISIGSGRECHTTRVSWPTAECRPSRTPSPAVCRRA